MKPIINFLGILTVALFGVLIYLNKGSFFNKPKEIPLYESTCNTAVTFIEVNGARVVGPCVPINAIFKVYKDSASLTFVGKLPLHYRVLGVDKDNALHLMREDSTQVLVFKLKDPRYPVGDKRSEVLHLIQRNGELLLFPSNVCP